jgi:hypothetical protein
MRKLQFGLPAKLAFNPFKKLVARQDPDVIKTTLGLEAIGDWQPQDVFLAGYPKSGNTWLQNILAGLLFGADPALLSDRLIQDLVPDVHAKKYYKRYADRVVFKTHLLPRPEYRHVIYILRDGRDVMVSYFHHLTALKKPVDILALARDGKLLFPCKWHHHVNEWLSNPFGARLEVVKYEDLKTDPVPVLRRLCGFLDIERGEAFLRMIVARTAFETMRRKEVEQGWDDRRWPKDKAFIRRGQVGSHRDEMPAEALAAFLADAAGTLARCGYGNDQGGSQYGVRVAA